MRRAERYQRVYEEVLRRAHPILIRGEGPRYGVYTGGELGRIMQDVDGARRRPAPITVWRMAQRLQKLYGLQARTVFELREMPAAVTRGGHTVRAHTRAVRVAVVLLPLDSRARDSVE